jgi:hypothetical protein
MVTTASTAVVRLIVLIVRVVKATIHYCSRYAPRCIKCTFFHTDSRNIRHSLGGTHSTIFSAQLADTFDMPPLPEPDYFQRAIERSPNISSIQSIPSPTVIKCYNVKFPGLKSLPDDDWDVNDKPTLPYKRGFTITAMRHQPAEPFNIGYDIPMPPKQAG